MREGDNWKRLRKILKEIFQLDQSDLDFGIYRIMNSKSREINEFLDKELISSVVSAFSSNNNSSIEKELNELIKTLTDAGMNADDSPKVQELKDTLSSTTSSSYFEYKIAKAHEFPKEIEVEKWHLETLAPTEKNKKRTIFEKHLKSYTSRNSFDYFIHKDLGGFFE